MTVLQSQWRIFTSAETEKGALAAGRSLLTGVPAGRAAQLAVTRYF